MRYFVMHDRWYLQIEVWNGQKLWRCFIMQHVVMEVFILLVLEYIGQPGSKKKKKKIQPHNRLQQFHNKPEAFWRVFTSYANKVWQRLFQGLKTLWKLGGLWYLIWNLCHLHTCWITLLVNFCIVNLQWNMIALSGASGSLRSPLD